VTTEWTLPPSVKGPQVGQVIAGRYRLALFKGGDDVAEVWHAVEESTQQVVTIEILRDRGDAALRTRFLEQAQRMAEIERPSVMKVVGIHDEANETFVVFEHLIPLVIELPDLPVETAAPAPPEPPAAALPEPAGSPEPAAAPVLPEWITPANVETEPVATEEPTPVEAVTTNESAAVESAAVEAVAVEAVAAREEPKTMRPVASLVSDPAVLIASATRFTQQARVLIRTGAAFVVTNAGPLLARARPLYVRARPWVVRARPWLVRARHNQIVMAVATAALVLVVFVASPLDDAIANAFRPKPTPAPTAAPPAPLARAPFEVPPLSAYGAAFESQAAYPKVAPNATVEWVVALRNTGSAGWYRGIDGAQVALALRDGAGVAVQSTEYVAPGQIGWFVIHFRARAEPGTYNVPLIPRVDGRGPLTDLGIIAVVTVVKNP
jgi:hypothetical protein